jgi:ComF family protein
MILDLLFPKQNNNYTSIQRYLSFEEIKELKPRFKMLSPELKQCFEGIFILTEYNDSKVSNLIERMKYKGEYSISNDISQAIIYHIFKDGSLFIPNPDIIIPIPGDKKRSIQRGYNIPSLIAKDLSEYTIKEFHSGSYHEQLLKTKNTVEQNKLNRIERVKNIKKSYAINTKNPISFSNVEHVWIIDDVITTGSTMFECGKLLKKQYPFIKLWGIVIASN